MTLRFKSRTSRDAFWKNYSSLDLLWGFAAPLVALLLRDPTALDASKWQDSLIYVAVGTVYTGLMFTWFRLTNSVSRFFSATDAMAVVKASAAAVLLTAATCFFATRLDNIPRSIPFLHFIVLATGNVAGRTVRRMRHTKRARLPIRTGVNENIVLVGVTRLSWLYIQIVEEVGAGEHQIVALLDESPGLQGRFVQGYPIAGRPQDIEQVLVEYKLHGVDVHKVVVGCDLESISDAGVAALRRATTGTPIRLEPLPERLGLGEPLSQVNEIEIEPIATSVPLHSFFWRSKRYFDAIVGLGMLVATAPLFGLAGVIVLIDCGMPVLFWQVRIGRYGDRMTVYKFRTLKAPFDRRGLQLSPEARLSFLGRFLRWSKLDELPQLFSIVAGDMSLVGPRPLLPVDLPPRIGLRQAVKPGLTGWAQVNGATLLTIDEKNAMDEWYVRHASWWLDLRIVILTVRLLIMGIARNEEAIQQAVTEKSLIDSDLAGIVDRAASSPPFAIVAPDRVIGSSLVD